MKVVLDRNAVLCRGKVVLYRMGAVDILEVDDTIRENLMTVLDDIHHCHTILDKLSTIKVLTDNLCPGANIIHGDALYATKHHLTQQQSIAIVQTHAWKLRHIYTTAKHHGFAPINWRNVYVEVGVTDVVNVLKISSMEKKNLFDKLF